MTDMPEKTLKPCPFCGGEAETNEGRRGDGSRWDYIACSDCEAMQPYVSQADLSGFDESWNFEKNAEAWNTRSDIAWNEALEAAPEHIVAFERENSFRLGQVQGFTYGSDHVVRDCWLPHGEQEQWRKPASDTSHDEMVDFIKAYCIRLAIRAMKMEPAKIAESA